MSNEKLGEMTDLREAAQQALDSDNPDIQLRAAITLRAALCDYCSRYFTLYSCGASLYGECDCPKCQGFCKCSDLRLYDGVSAVAVDIEAAMREDK